MFTKSYINLKNVFVIYNNNFFFLDLLQFHLFFVFCFFLNLFEKFEIQLSGVKLCTKKKFSRSKTNEPAEPAYENIFSLNST